MTEKDYKKALSDAIRYAHEHGNLITEEAYRDCFGDTGLDEKEDELTRNYLREINIRFEGSGDEAPFEVSFGEKDGKYLDLYLEELAGLPVYSREEILDAKKRAIEDDDEGAQEILINHYLKNVVDIAKLYIYQSLPAEDLIGEGNIGMMSAVRALTLLDTPEEVDSFVGKFIMDAMDAAVYEDNDIREQISQAVAHINEINDKARELCEALQRTVTVKELSDETGIKEKDIREAMRLSGNRIEGLKP